MAEAEAGSLLQRWLLKHDRNTEEKATQDVQPAARPRISCPWRCHFPGVWVSVLPKWPGRRWKTAFLAPLNPAARQLAAEKVGRDVCLSALGPAESRCCPPWPQRATAATPGWCGRRGLPLWPPGGSRRRCWSDSSAGPGGKEERTSS